MSLVASTVSSTVSVGSVPVVLMLGPSSLNTRFCSDVERRAPAVAVLVGDGPGERHQVVCRQALRVVWIGRIRMNHCPLLVQRHIAIGGRADREHKVAVAAVTASVPARPSTTPEFTNRNTWLPLAVSTSPESAPEALTPSAYTSVPAPSAPNAEVKLAAKFCRVVGRQHRLVHRQRRLRARRADARPIVLEHQVRSDVEHRLRLSPSLSVMVPVSVTRLSAVRLFESSGLVASG